MPHEPCTEDGARRAQQQSPGGEDPRQPEGEDDHQHESGDRPPGTGVRTEAEHHADGDHRAGNEVADALPVHRIKHWRGSPDRKRRNRSTAPSSHLCSGHAGEDMTGITVTSASCSRTGFTLRIARHAK